MKFLCGSYIASCVGVFSIITALLSAAEPIKKDSDTNIFRFDAMANASCMFDAYCRISVATKETGVADAEGVVVFAALMVTYKPVSFMPETVPKNPPQVTVIYR